MDSKNHWEKIYSTKTSDSVSWFQQHADKSLSIIKKLNLQKNASILDVGGGASTLVDDLLEEGFTDVSVLDLSAAALATAKKRLGGLSASVKWIEADITALDLQKHSIDVWHDRAVFHFLTSKSDRDKYIKAVLNIVRPGGFVIVATFAEDGPEQCSGLAVQRYSASELHSEFGNPFQLLGHEKEEHKTPSGNSQSFVYCYCRKNHS